MDLAKLVDMVSVANQFGFTMKVDNQSQKFVFSDSDDIESDYFDLDDSVVDLIRKVLCYIARTHSHLMQNSKEAEPTPTADFEKALEALKEEVRWVDCHNYIARSPLLTVSLAMQNCYVYYRDSRIFQSHNAYDPERQKYKVDGDGFCFDLPKEFGELAKFVEHDARLYQEAEAEKQSKIDEVVRKYEDTVQALNERVQKISNGNSAIYQSEFAPYSVRAWSQDAKGNYCYYYRRPPTKRRHSGWLTPTIHNAYTIDALDFILDYRKNSTS